MSVKSWTLIFGLNAVCAEFAVKSIFYNPDKLNIFVLAGKLETLFTNFGMFTLTMWEDGMYLKAKRPIIQWRRPDSITRSYGCSLAHFLNHKIPNQIE